MKYLLWLLVGVVGWWLWRRHKSAAARVEQAPPPPVENMGRCAHCGVHAPLSDMLADGQGRLYCSAAHRELGPAGRDRS